MQAPLEEQFARAAELIAQADALIVGAGAGMGVDSGSPDFRGRNGFWRFAPSSLQPAKNRNFVQTEFTESMLH